MVDVPLLGSSLPAYVTKEYQWLPHAAKRNFSEFLDLAALESEPSTTIQYHSDVGFIAEDKSEANALRMEKFMNHDSMRVDEKFWRLNLTDIY